MKNSSFWSNRISLFTLLALLFSTLSGISSASANQLPQLPAGVSLPSGVSLPGGVSLPSGASLPSASGGTTMGNSMTITEDQIKNLPEDQQKSIREALEKAKAAAGASPSSGESSGTPSVDLSAIASQAQGLISSLTKKLTPEQQKMLAEAQKSGKLPDGFAEMLVKGSADPAMLEKLTPEQRSALQAAIASGELSAENIKSLIGEIDVSTVKEVAKAVSENKPVDVNKVKETLTKVASLICTNGKKRVTVKTKTCPKGFKKA